MIFNLIRETASFAGAFTSTPELIITSFVLGVAFILWNNIDPIDGGSSHFLIPHLPFLRDNTATFLF